MTQTQTIRQDIRRGSPMGRFIAFLYGIASYVVFFVTIALARSAAEVGACEVGPLHTGAT